MILLRSIGLSVDLKPIHLFSDFEPGDNCRPDILIRNPYGGGRQIIIDVAVTGIDGTARTNNNKPSQPIIARRKQKTRKYGPIADANHLRQMDVIIKNLFLEQIRLKLQLVDGEVKKSKVQKIMKHCVRHISAAINRLASRNIFLKATKMVNLACHTQQNFSSSSSSPEDLLQQFELQIMNQDVVQMSKSKFYSQIWKTLDTCLQ